MPSRRPGALRAEQSPRVPWSVPPPRIHGLSSRTGVAIDRVERLSDDYYLYPGATDRALRRYAAFLRPPGRRPLYPQETGCSCRGCSFEDIRHARDVLEEVLRRLPPRPQGELRDRVRALDVGYAGRTLPDRFTVRRPWRPDRWWWRRLADGPEGR